jgi:phage gp16-like protein
MSRTFLIKIIHIAKRRLLLDDDTYHATLQRVTGRDICRTLTDYRPA